MTKATRSRRGPRSKKSRHGQNELGGEAGWSLEAHEEKGSARGSNLEGSPSLRCGVCEKEVGSAGLKWALGTVPGTCLSNLRYIKEVNLALCFSPGCHSSKEERTWQRGLAKETAPLMADRKQSWEEGHLLFQATPRRGHAHMRATSWGHLFFCCFFEIGSCYVLQAGLELTV